MSGRNGPLSPISVGGSEWSRFQSPASDAPFSPSLYNTNRGQLASPPISSGSNSMSGFGMQNGGGFPARGSSSGSPGGAPSPPASIARSSVGTGLYAPSESGANKKDEAFEASLSEHYVALKRYLASSLRDEKGNPRPNRARDKLLRLSPVQFQELSTDVFDELLRRQQTARQPPNAPPNKGPPTFLLPKKTFHPKRNQARQKLSTLPPPRFRDLATDVFYELERRFPRFAGGDISRMGSPASTRGPPSRNGTPANGSRDPSRMRRPSDASSIAYSMRSESRPGMNGLVPPSPGLPPNDFGRPTPKTFQSNTLVPNKSTMVEDDESGGDDHDDDDGDAFGLEGAARKRDSKKSAEGSETDKKLIDDYQSQVAELREKLDSMEDTLKQKDDELSAALDGKNNGSEDNQEWSELRQSLESQITDIQNLNETLQSELDRVRASQATTERELRAQLEEARSPNGGSRGSGGSDLEKENQELREELEEQQQVTDEVRREAQEFLREMRTLSERSSSSYEREEQLTATVNKLEDEVRDWRNRYARTKTQLRGLRAGSIGLTIQAEASKYTKELTREDGLVKDVHVTKFQISIDELLQTARTEDPVRVVEYMKAVVVSVRRITQDIDEVSNNGGLSQQQTKLKSRVSATANNLITASKNFAAAKGLSPVSLLDAAASHLTTAVVELVRTVKIRATPAGELEDDDDGNIDPVDSTGYFPVREPGQQNGLAAFSGLRNGRTSGNSSMYSPANSPRESAMRPKSSGKESWAGRNRSMSRGSPMTNGLNITNGNGKSGAVFGTRTPDPEVEDLKIYLEDQTALLVQSIQSLVSSIRSDAGINALSKQLASIADVVGKVVSSTEGAISNASNGALRSQAEPTIQKLSACHQRILDAKDRGTSIANEERDDEEGERNWRAWNQSLPPIAFEIARETKELVTKLDTVDGRGDDDFS